MKWAVLLIMLGAAWPAEGALTSPARLVLAVPAGLPGLLATLNLADGLDLDRVERERTRLVETLFGRLTAGEAERLIERTTAYSIGLENRAGYHRHLTELLRRHGIAIENYPAVAQYLRYLRIVEGVPVERLLN